MKAPFFEFQSDKNMKESSTIFKASSKEGTSQSLGVADSSHSFHSRCHVPPDQFGAMQLEIKQAMWNQFSLSLSLKTVFFYC